MTRFEKHDFMQHDSSLKLLDAPSFFCNSGIQGDKLAILLDSGHYKLSGKGVFDGEPFPFWGPTNSIRMQTWCFSKWDSGPCLFSSSFSPTRNVARRPPSPRRSFVEASGSVASAASKSPWCAAPTLAHHTLVALHSTGAGRAGDSDVGMGLAFGVRHDGGSHVSQHGRKKRGEPPRPSPPFNDVFVKVSLRMSLSGFHGVASRFRAPFTPLWNMKAASCRLPEALGAAESRRPAAESGVPPEAHQRDPRGLVGSFQPSFLVLRGFEIF